MIGRTLSHFEVIEKLGEGGMGVVYKARDTQLNRFVALKVLPPAKIADPERRRRFIQEARAASSLSHPNIVTIYEIAQADGVDFIAMEFVAGRTLDRVIPRGGMKVTEALRIAVQIADGLARAHAAGIVHRDLKPTNIMVADGGGPATVKILDFGLAKLTEVGSSSPDDVTRTSAGEDVVRTDDGSLLGTVAYMAPEQAEGKPVTATADIFAFGAVLYEMLSGRQAFAAGNKQATLAAILRDDPPALPRLPHELEKLVARCLRKDPTRRAQHMADVKLALEELKEESESGFSGAGVAAALPPTKRKWIWPAVGLALLAAGGFVLFKRRNQPEPQPEMKTTVLTSYPGRVAWPVLSPDGKQVAFTWTGEKGDNADIYVKLTDAGTPIRLTHDPSDDLSPAWSPDGRFLAFVRLSREGKGGYFIIPALGGPERKIADIPRKPSHRPDPSTAWTPDSKSLVLVDTSLDPPTLVQVSVSDGARTKITTPPASSLGDYRPAVSPDGKWLAFDRVPAVSVQEWKLVAFKPESDANRPATLFPSLLAGVESQCVWSGTRSELFCDALDNGISKLLRVPLPAPSKPEPLLVAGSDVASPSVALQANRLVFVHSFANASLWLASLADTRAAAQRIISSTRNESQPDYSPDGSRIAFISSRSGAHELWTASADGSNPVQLTNQSARPTAPRWSPDGSKIAFAQRPGGNVDVFVIEAQGGAPRRLTTDPANDASAYWSRDGKSIYFASNRTGRQEVWRVPADGSAREEQITRNGGWRSSESLDGKSLYYQKFDMPGLFRMPLPNGTEERIGDVPPIEDWHLSPDGTAVYYFQPQGETFVVQRLDLKTGKLAEALKLPPGTRGGTTNFTISPDGRWLVFCHTDQTVSELMLIDNFR